MSKLRCVNVVAPVLALAAAVLQPVAAQVTSMSADGSYQLGAGALTVLPSSLFPPNPYVDVLSFPSVGNDSAGLHTYGSTSGNFGSRSSGQGVYHVTGSYNITEVISNPGPTPMAATMNFNITPGLLLNSVNTALAPGEFVNASVSFDIKVGASTVWGSSALLSSNNTSTGVFSSSGAALYTFQTPTYYSINGGAYSVSLGMIAPSGSITMSYTLSTTADGNSATGPGVWVPTQTVTVPDQWLQDCKNGAGAPGMLCPTVFRPGSTTTIPGHFQPSLPSGSQGSSGDPFSIDGTTGAVLNLPFQAGDPNGLHISLAPVPEPATLALMLGGLAMLGWCLQRRA